MKVVSKGAFPPYHYQMAVAEALIENRNIILSVPTGAGKTWASVLPFMFARENKLAFPQKMIYSTPLRTLTNAIHETIKDKFPETAIQTGEFSEDALFENDVIFSTIDQTLSNFLCFPLAISPSQANINAGAMIGSYLVFDEFHLLDGELSMATTIGMLKKLDSLCRCCIMTATLSEEFRKALTEFLPNYEVITLDDYPEDKQHIRSLLPSQNKKQIKVQEQNGVLKTLNANDIIDHHIAHHKEKKKSIVICNRVEKAQKIYSQLVEKQKMGEIPSDTELVCLHSRFFDIDRKGKEKQLKRLFGENSNFDAILVATQVIEAGLDISCDVMHTEISPVDSFLQRVGRCARFADETGQIFIYDVEEQDSEEGKYADDDEKKLIRSKYRKYLPYAADISEETLAELENNHHNLDGDTPKILIEKLLTKQDQQLLAKLKSGSDGGFNQDRISKSWRECTKTNYRYTIRDIQSTEIILMRPQDEVEFLRNPYIYQSISMFRFSFQKWFKEIQEVTDSEDWVAKYLCEGNVIDFMADEKQLYFSKVTDYTNIPSQVFVNAELFRYDAGFGLSREEGGVRSSPKKTNDKSKPEESGLTKDTFVEHSLGLYGYYLKDFRPKLSYTFSLLNALLGSEFSDEQFDELFRLMFAYHDLGKLNRAWQEPMQRYQAHKDGVAFSKFREVLAHTDFDRNNEVDLALSKQFKLNKRPTHASIGALAIEPVLKEMYDDEYLTSAISFAIARHHSAGDRQVSSCPHEIPEINFAAFRQLTEEMNLNVPKPALQSKSEEHLDIDGEDTSWLLYFFFVRILRLCDQKATRDLAGSKIFDQ